MPPARKRGFEQRQGGLGLSRGGHIGLLYVGVPPPGNSLHYCMNTDYVWMPPAQTGLNNNGSEG